MMNDIFTELSKAVILWDKTDDSNFVFSSEFRNTEILLRLNDFPDEPLCTLIVNDASIDLDEFPDGWSLPIHRDREEKDGVVNFPNKE